MIKIRIAKRYARALFELAEEEGRIEEIGRDLAVIDALFVSDSAIRDGLTSPVKSHEAKAEVLTAIIEATGADKMVGNFLFVMLEARKLTVLPQVNATYMAMADEATGKLRGEVITPMPLEESALQTISAALSKALGKEVILEARQDPSLMGGMVARVGNLVFDASVKTQLQRMKDTLIKG